VKKLRVQSQTRKEFCPFQHGFSSDWTNESWNGFYVFRGSFPFSLHVHNYLRLQITKKIYNGRSLVTLKGKRNKFVWIFKTVANMQICRGLFHVKVNLRAFGKRLPLLTLRGKKEMKREEWIALRLSVMRRIIYGVCSWKEVAGCGEVCRFIKQSILLPNKEMSLSTALFGAFCILFKDI
jgi:hypothetical protein